MTVIDYKSGNSLNSGQIWYHLLKPMAVTEYMNKKPNLVTDIGYIL